MDEETEIMAKPMSFAHGGYAQTLRGLLWEPQKYFSHMNSNAALNPSLKFLFISAIIYTSACLLSYMYEKPIITGISLFIGTIGTVFVSASIGFIIMKAISKHPITYQRFFSIFAHASGISLHVSWMPFAVFISEPWKWWLIATGLKKGCHLEGRCVMMIIAVSFAVLFLLYGVLLPRVVA